MRLLITLQEEEGLVWGFYVLRPTNTKIHAFTLALPLDQALQPRWAMPVVKAHPNRADVLEPCPWVRNDQDAAAGAGIAFVPGLSLVTMGRKPRMVEPGGSQPVKMLACGAPVGAC